MQGANISAIKINDFVSIKSISDACFGENYLTAAHLNKMLEKEGIYSKIEVNGNLIGFCLAQIINNDKESLEFKVHESKEEKFAIIKTLAIQPNFQRKGYGTQLLKFTISEIKSLSYSPPIYYPSWIESKSDGFRKSVKNEGFKEFKLYKDFWSTDSLQHNYICVRCGNPPCHCSMLLYKKD